MREPRQANCSFITHFLGQTSSAVFSQKQKEKKNLKRQQNPIFNSLHSRDAVSAQACPTGDAHPVSPGAVPWDSHGSGRVSRGVLGGMSPGMGAGLSPQTMAPLPLLCLPRSVVALARSSPGCWGVPCAPQHSGWAPHPGSAALGGLVPVAQSSPVQQRGFYRREISYSFEAGRVDPKVLPHKEVGAQRRANELKRQIGASTMRSGTSR